MANLPVPIPRTFTVDETETGAFFNTQRDALNFLLGPPDLVVNQSVAQTLTSGANAMVSFNATIVDTYGGHSNSTNNSRYTCQAAGWYWFKGNPVVVSNATGGRTCSLFKNGAQITTSFVVYPAAGTFYAAMGIECSTLLQLSVGDYVELSVAQDSGGNLSTYVAGAQSNLQGWLVHV